MEQYIFYTSDIKLNKYNGTIVEVIQENTTKKNMCMVRFYDGCTDNVYDDELRSVS